LPSNYHNFEFDNTPISQVFTTLEKAYGIEIVYDEGFNESMLLTAPLGNESLLKNESSL